MSKLLFAALCDDVREEKSGKFSLMGLFDRFVVGDFRVVLPTFWFFAQIGFDAEGDHALVIEFRRVEGQSIMRAEARHQVLVRNSVTRLYHASLNLRVANLTVPGPGAYEFAVHSDGEHVSSLPIEVIQPPPQLVQ